MIQKVLNKIEQTSVGKKISSDVAYRTSLLAGWGLCINLIYAVMNGVLGVVNRSLWFITLFAYYLILCHAFLRGNLWLERSTQAL